MTLLSNALEIINSQTTPQETTEDDHKQISKILKLTHIVTSQSSTTLNVGESKTVETNSLNVLVSKGNLYFNDFLQSSRPK